MDVFNPPTFYDEAVAEHTNLETHFIDSSGLISWDLFKQDADYPFVDWKFSAPPREKLPRHGDLLQRYKKFIMPQTEELRAGSAASSHVQIHPMHIKKSCKTERITI
ncbi:hypothetical protein ACNKHN_05045 [Shigella flexneri]